MKSVPNTSNLPTSDFLPVSELTASLRSEMRQLYGQYFDDDSQFEADLAAKDWVLLLIDERGQLGGFSTLRRLRLESVTAFYSGDTVVRSDRRASWDLPQLWIRSLQDLIAVEPGPCYWFLICSGFRTYRFLPVFFREFFPRFDRPTPPDQQLLLDRLGALCFGPLYTDGVVRLTSACRESLPERRFDRHSEFFFAANPGWREGHELACLTLLDGSNMTSAGLRMLNPR